MTLNNQLIKMKAEVGDKIACNNWLGRVFMNEFGLGICMDSSHEPRALCDGFFPEMRGLKIYRKVNDED